MSGSLYVTSDLQHATRLDEPRLLGTSERHRLSLARVSRGTRAPATSALAASGGDGVVLEMSRGWPGRVHLRMARRLLDEGRRVWFYWPEEQAVEVVDRERLRSLWRLWAAAKAYGGARRLLGGRPAVDHGGGTASEIEARHLRALDAAIEQARPAGWPWARVPGPRDPLPGTGVYLRTDFWAPITSGGSYGHTCFVAQELAAVTEHVTCLMAHRFPLLDEMGLRQVVLDLPSASQNEEDLLRANAPYYAALRVTLEAVRPAYVYERLCLGNYVAARLCRELGVPYIVEYNGSEISMRRSFEGTGYRFEEIYRKAEALAFRQATLITVVSEVLKRELAARGIDPARILVNPNGADVRRYAPPAAGERQALRHSLGWDDSHTVVGFTGTFGGWHGIDVLSAALPAICRARPGIRFLLIGDGNLKGRIDRVIAEHRLGGQVHCAGRVPQQEGARLLGACDLFVSPHSSHMIDSRFFGSPTKLFEYMAMAGGIVASDLEQLGDVLSPALTLEAVEAPGVGVTDERAVLVPPGEVEPFVRAVVALADRPMVARALGRNAREAVTGYFAWNHHIRRTLEALSGQAVEKLDYRPVRRAEMVAAAAGPADAGSAGAPALIETGDRYKDQVQQQWNNDPAGSHYVKRAQRHTLEWYLEVEAHRYGEYAPWMPETMEFARHGGERVLEVGGGLGTDLAQFARHGAIVTDLDLSAGHLELARENFRLRGLCGTFLHHDAETLPFPDASFDLVYSNGVIHHTPNTQRAVDEIFRVLRPGGRAIVMVYAERSLHYWGVQVLRHGLHEGRLEQWSMGEVMSQGVERSGTDALPLVKVYSRRRLRTMFGRFAKVQLRQRQATRPELIGPLRWLSADLVGRIAGWNLVVKAARPR